jgi:RNA polymerase sigma-70 factor (ECF subfamily)
MTLKSDSALGLPLLVDGQVESTDAAIEQQVLALFDTTAPSLLRYVQSFGLPRDETEDVVQEAFLALFYHLRIGRPRTNLRGWLFKVAHNLALRQRKRRKRRDEPNDVEQIELHVDPKPDPEVRLALTERARRLRSVFRALSSLDRQCLFLRAEGLRYREIAATLGISLGGVARSLARSMTRLVNADRR